MPIETDARLEVISALSAFMRGEIHNFAFDDALDKILSDDKALQDVVAVLWFFYDDCKAHKISVTEEKWNCLRRLIAFLKCGLEQPPIRLPPSASARFAKSMFGLISLLFVLGASYLAIVDAVYWPLILVVLIGFPYWIVTRVRRDMPDPHPFYPFVSEEQWLRYEPLIADEHLPTYDPALHG